MCPCHILIAEDEPALANLYLEYLHVGFAVSVCTDGIEALALFNEHPDQFDLVLTDYAMPNLTGKELIRKLLNIRPDLPIILSTGYHDLIDEVDIKDLGVRQCLMKPLRLKTLKETIELHVTRSY